MTQQRLTDSEVALEGDRLRAARRRIASAHEALMKASDEYDRVLDEVTNLAKRSPELQAVVSAALAEPSHPLVR